MTSTLAGDAVSTRRSGLTPLFAPRGIAVVGASRTPGKLGAALAGSLSGFVALDAVVVTREANDA